MLALKLDIPPDRPLRILCLGAHCDDIEIGCGATILELLGSRRATVVDWVVLSSTAPRRSEAERAAASFLEGAAERRVAIHDFPDRFFPWHGERLKRHFDAMRESIDPDVVFTHHREDRHQDHRVVAELTWNAWRDQFILEYEIPKWEGDLGHPNLYVPVAEAACRRKCAILRECFPSQRDKHWFTDDVFLGLMRVRGVECASPTRFAEAFHSPKAVLR